MENFEIIYSNSPREANLFLEEINQRKYSYKMKDEFEILKEYLHWKIDNFESLSVWYRIRFYQKTGALLIPYNQPSNFQHWKEMNGYN